MREKVTMPRTQNGVSSERTELHLAQLCSSESCNWDWMFWIAFSETLLFLENIFFYEFYKIWPGKSLKNYIS